MDDQKLIASLQRSLKRASNKATKDWFDAYLKGAIPHRGVKAPEVIAIVRTWYIRNRIGDHAHSSQLAIAADLIRQKYAEDKFAGIFFIQKYLLSAIDFDVFLRLHSKACSQAIASLTGRLPTGLMSAF